MRPGAAGYALTLLSLVLLGDAVVLDGAQTTLAATDAQAPGPYASAGGPASQQLSDRANPARLFTTAALQPGQSILTHTGFGLQKPPTVAIDSQSDQIGPRSTRLWDRSVAEAEQRGDQLPSIYPQGSPKQPSVVNTGFGLEKKSSSSGTGSFSEAGAAAPVALPLDTLYQEFAPASSPKSSAKTFGIGLEKPLADGGISDDSLAFPPSGGVVSPAPASQEVKSAIGGGSRSRKGAFTGSFQQLPGQPYRKAGPGTVQAASIGPAATLSAAAAADPGKAAQQPPLANAGNLTAGPPASARRRALLESAKDSTDDDGKEEKESSTESSPEVETDKVGQLVEDALFGGQASKDITAQETSAKKKGKGSSGPETARQLSEVGQKVESALTAAMASAKKSPARVKKPQAAGARSSHQGGASKRGSKAATPEKRSGAASTASLLSQAAVGTKSSGAKSAASETNSGSILSKPQSERAGTGNSAGADMAKSTESGSNGEKLVHMDRTVSHALAQAFAAAQVGGEGVGKSSSSGTGTGAGGSRSAAAAAKSSLSAATTTNPLVNAATTLDGRNAGGSGGGQSDASQPQGSRGGGEDVDSLMKELAAMAKPTAPGQKAPVEPSSDASSQLKKKPGNIIELISGRRQQQPKQRPAGALTVASALLTGGAKRRPLEAAVQLPLAEHTGKAGGIHHTSKDGHLLQALKQPQSVPLLKAPIDKLLPADLQIADIPNSLPAKQVQAPVSGLSAVASPAHGDMTRQQADQTSRKLLLKGTPHGSRAKSIDSALIPQQLVAAIQVQNPTPLI